MNSRWQMAWGSASASPTPFVVHACYQARAYGYRQVEYWYSSQGNWRAIDSELGLAYLVDTDHRETRYPHVGTTSSGQGRRQAEVQVLPERPVVPELPALARLETLSLWLPLPEGQQWHTAESFDDALGREVAVHTPDGASIIVGSTRLGAAVTDRETGVVLHLRGNGGEPIVRTDDFSVEYGPSLPRIFA